ncbi:MAG TPA: hypothetical protein VE175_03100 [Woeseiaceae bacterium]|nr:hypothetical protein [Woeseiaceae bacterium]
MPFAYGMKLPGARRILDLSALLGFVVFGGVSAAAPNTVNASPTDAPEPVSHQFFEAMGLSMNMCTSLAQQRALELGFQVGVAPANAPKEGKRFVNPAVPREEISFRPEENEGHLELADLRLFVSNTLFRDEIMGEVERIKALYGPDACRESSVNLVCDGTRYVGPYQVSLRAEYDTQWIRYTFRSRFQPDRFFEPSPVCVTSTDAAPPTAGPSARPDNPPNPASSTDTSDSPPATTSPPGLPSQPASGDPEPASPASPQRATTDSPSFRGPPGQKLFESAQTLEEQAYAQDSPELHAAAAKLYQQAAALEHAQAMFNLSRKYARGEGVERSPETELELLERAAKMGLPQAQYNLALKYASGSGVVENQERAAELLEAAADAGDADARLAMAKRKLAGSGSERSDQEAIDLLEEAAEGGSAEAQYLLGRILEEGILAPRDAQRSEQYFCTAAAIGYKPAVAKCERSFLAPNDTAKQGRQIRY